MLFQYIHVGQQSMRNLISRAVLVIKMCMPQVHREKEFTLDLVNMAQTKNVLT